MKKLIVIVILMAWVIWWLYGDIVQIYNYHMERYKKVTNNEAQRVP
jgi:hypothetical protein